MSASVTMYTTPWCGYCRRLKRQMVDEGIHFREVDVDVHHDFDEQIMAATGGYRTVPTVEVGTRLLVNPTLREIRAAVADGVN
jgi:mycoredoxin